MPKVTDEHRERRRQQILDAARTCFVRKGFHQTSMADVLAEAGMSAGAVYGYFRSKDEIVVAIATQFLSSVRRLLEPIADQDPVQPLDQAFDTALQTATEFGFGTERLAELAPMVWAEVPRNPALREVIRAEYGGVRRTFAEVVAAEQDAGHFPRGANADDVAAVLFGSLIGFTLQKALMDDVERETYMAALRALMQVGRPDA